jgi:hypothetical protein
LNEIAKVCKKNKVVEFLDENEAVLIFKEIVKNYKKESSLSGLLRFLEEYEHLKIEYTVNKI